jgi:hypothetical protein
VEPLAAADENPPGEIVMPVAPVVPQPSVALAPVAMLAGLALNEPMVGTAAAGGDTGLEPPEPPEPPHPAAVRHASSSARIVRAGDARHPVPRAALLERAGRGVSTAIPSGGRLDSAATAQPAPPRAGGVTGSGRL